MAETEVLEGSGPVWQAKSAEDLVREVLGLAPGTSLPEFPEYLKVRSRGYNRHGGGEYSIPLAPNYFDYRERPIWRARRVVFEADEPEGDGDIDWAAWKIAASDWARGVSDDALQHVRECYNDEEIHDFVPDDMPDPEDYREEPDEDEHEYCLQVVGESDDDYAIPHLDWALAMYMMLKDNEAQFLENANEDP